jgi:hypothetical protein
MAILCQYHCLVLVEVARPGLIFLMAEARAVVADIQVF